MFGLFKNRKRYNGTVDTKLNNEYQIKTRDNDLFPGMMAYLGLIDNAWGAKMSEDEAAMYIATLYYCGLKQHKHHAEARAVGRRISEVGQFGVSRGSISMEHASKFLAAMEESNHLEG